jgi:hypothetical protein
MNMYKYRIRCATDEQLQSVIAFFEAPELRKYYAGLIDDCRCELRLREIAKEEEPCE